MRKIILFGANGKLGRMFLKLYPEIKGFTHKEADITDREKIISIVKKNRPDMIINCAGLTNVDYCERHPEEAWDANVRGVRNLAEAANEFNCLLIHFSSNYALHPVNEYAWTKLASESVAGLNGLVIRTTFYDESFWLIKSILEGKEAELLTNEYFNPISSLNLAKTALSLAEKNAGGIINVGTKEKISRYEFGIKLCEAMGADKKIIKPVSFLKGKRDAKRHPDNYLPVKELEKHGIRVLTIEEDLASLKNSEGWLYGG